MPIFWYSPKVINYYSRFIAKSKNKGYYNRVKLDTDMKSLNNDQRKAVDVLQDAIKKKERLYMVIHGIAGTGKSFVLHTIRSMIAKKWGAGSVLVLAPSGVAATHISGQTIHSGLKVPLDFQTAADVNFDAWLADELEKCKQGGCRMEKRLQQLNLMQSAHEDFKKVIRNVKFIIIDECSMLSLQLFGYIESTLRDFVESDKFFAGKSVILLGDFGQLPPVGATPLYGDPAVGDLLAAQGKIAYEKFNKVVFLDQVVRQLGDDQATFRNLLTSIRQGTVSISQVDLLNTRAWKNLSAEQRESFQDAVYLFPINKDVNSHNENELKKLDTPKVHIKVTRPEDEEETLPDCNHLAIGAKVMLLQNLWTEAGLVNGATGTVHSIVYEEGTREPEMPAFVNIKFEKYRGVYPEGQDSVPIKPVVLISSSFKGETWKQLPIRVCYASTVHKSQSRTIPKLVVDFSSSSRIPICQIFVALSRAPTLASIALAIPFTLEQFRDHDASLEAIKREESRLRAMAI